MEDEDGWLPAHPCRLSSGPVAGPGQVIRQLRDQALESGNPFDVDGRSLDAAAFDACGMAWIGWIAISGM